MCNFSMCADLGVLEISEKSYQIDRSKDIRKKDSFGDIRKSDANVFHFKRLMK